MSSRDSVFGMACLVCDKHLRTGQVYCSQACKLAELEKASHSEPASPATYGSSYGNSALLYMFSDYIPAASQPMPKEPQLKPKERGFYLDPALDFSKYKTVPHNYDPATAACRGLMPNGEWRTVDGSKLNYGPFVRDQVYTGKQHTFFATYPAPANGSKGLNSPSSRASLNSINSVHGSQGISEKDLTQLRGYANAFDQTRELKRRMSSHVI